MVVSRKMFHNVFLDCLSNIPQMLQKEFMIMRLLLENVFKRTVEAKTMESSWKML